MTDTPEITAIRELLEARCYADSDRALRTLRTLLAAHDARESAPSVEVRIAVGVDEHGFQGAAIDPRASDSDLKTRVRRRLSDDAAIVFITARVPLPQSQEIEGRVE